MQIKQAKNIKTQEEARQFAIDWQQWASERAMSWEDVVVWNNCLYRTGQSLEKVCGTVQELTRDKNEYHYILGKKSVLDAVRYLIDSELKKNI